MVEGKTVAIIAALTALGGYYLAFNRAGSKMCSDANFATQMTTFKGTCPNPSTYDILKYYTF